MKAVVIDRFGGREELRLREVRGPELGPGDVLIAVHAAGVGSWDPFEREGGYADATGTPPVFPYVLGSEGAGTIEAVGEGVDRFEPGDAVYAAAFLNPTGGFYAEYAAVDAGLVAHIPHGMTMEQAAAVLGVSLTALRGLDDVLSIRPGESVVIVGASGGIGHVAVQLATRMGARVLAVASGPDGSALAARLGAEQVVDGRAERIADALSAFAPGGVDAALLTTGGDAAEQAVSTLRDGGRVAAPTGVDVDPASWRHVEAKVYNGEPDRALLEKFERLVGSDPLEVHVAGTFALGDTAQAHAALAGHHLGKFVLRVR